MHLKEFNKVLVIISTKGKKFNIIKDKIESKLSKLIPKEKYQILLTTDKDTIKNSSKEFAENNNSLLIIVGGDGSISEAVNEIYHTDICIAFLPNGTGNDLSKTIYPNMSFDDILENIENISIRKIDLIKINENVSVNVTSFGYDSFVLLKSLEIKEKYPFLSKLSFVLGVLLTLNKIKKYKYDFTITLDNGNIIKGQKEYILTALCNGQYYGNGFNPAPFGSITDGIIDLNTIDYLKIPKLLWLLMQYKDERHLKAKESNNYKVISGKFIRTDKSKILGNIDGNPYECNKLEFSSLPQSLNLAIFKK